MATKIRRRLLSCRRAIAIEKSLHHCGCNATGVLRSAGGARRTFGYPSLRNRCCGRTSWLRSGNYNWLSVVGRLKPGISSDKARADLDLIFNQVLMERASRIENEHDRRQFLSQKIQVTSASNGLSRLRQQFSKPLLILMVVVAVVLTDCVRQHCQPAACTRDFTAPGICGSPRAWSQPLSIDTTTADRVLTALFSGRSCESAAGVLGQKVVFLFT